jgi:hypothetical protein
VAQIEKSLSAPQVNEEEIVRCESMDGMQELSELLGGAAAKEENTRIGDAGHARATSAVQQTMQAKQEEMDEDAWAVEEADMIKRSLAAQREAVFSPSPRARARAHREREREREREGDLHTLRSVLVARVAPSPCLGARACM